MAGSAWALSALAADTKAIEPWDPDKPLVVTGKPLRVQPVLMHTRCQPREKTSWRSWSSVINDEAAAEEMNRIRGELDALAKRADFPLEILPLAKATSPEEGAKIQDGQFDAVLLYAASGGGDLFRACAAKAPERDTVVFVRHRSGPTYYWYECLGTRQLKTPTVENGQRTTPGTTAASRSTTSWSTTTTRCSGGCGRFTG